MSSGSGSLPVRFYVQLRDASAGGFTQHTLSQPCHPTALFGEIKAALWLTLSSQNANPPAMSDYVFQLSTGEVTFEDDDIFSRFVATNEIFRESTPSSLGATMGTAEQPMLECVVFHRDNVADRYTREMRMPAISGLLQHRGALSVRVDGLVGASWKRRYAAIYDMSFFLFDSEENYNKRDMSSVDFLLLGPVVAVRVEPTTSDRGHTFLFEIKKATAPVSQGGPASLSASSLPTSAANIVPAGPGSKPLIFYTETEQALYQWISTINRLYLRRVKLLCASIAEELESRGLESSEGLFRLSAHRLHVEQLQAEFDKSKAPNLGLISDEHVLAGVLKNNLRNMPEPLLTFEAYPHMIKVVQTCPLKPQDPESLRKRLEGLRSVVDRLPQSNAGLLEFLMGFLTRVSEHSATNRMSASNLAIVFSPNILRPRVENVSSIMADSKLVLDCVETMINHARDLWPNYTNTRRTSKLAFFTGSRTPTVGGGGGGGGAVAPATAAPRTPKHNSNNNNLPSVAEAPQPHSSTLNSNMPPRRVGPPPPPQQANDSAAASSPNSATSPTSPLPVGAVRLPFVPIGGVQLMSVRGGKFGAAGGAAVTPPALPSSTTSAPISGAAVPPPGRSGAPLPGPPPGAPPPTAAGPLKGQLEVSSPLPVPSHLPLPSELEAASSRAPRPSIAGPVALAALPEEMLALQEDSTALCQRWTASLKLGGVGMADALTSLLDAHAFALGQGLQSSENSASTALTIQRCVNVLAADMAKWEAEYTNLIKFVEEQVKAVPGQVNSAAAKPAAKFAGRPHRSSSATKPQRQAAVAPTPVTAKPPPLPPLPTTAPVLPATPPAIPALPAMPSAAVSPVSPTPPPLPPAVPVAAPVAAPVVTSPPITTNSVSPSSSSAAAPALPPPPPAPRAEPGDMVVVQFAYDGGADSLTLVVGDKLLLIEGDESDTEWWLGRRQGGAEEEGYFPAAFVALL